MVIHLPSFLGFARLFIALCWLGFIFAFSFRKKGSEPPTARRVTVSWAGIALQSAGIAMVWFLGSDWFPASAPPLVVVRVLSVLAALLAAASVWLVVSAIRVLGKQWSLQARLVEGHRLVVEGPYSHMRHPIYTGMLGMLLATGLAFSVWWALMIALPIFAAGTAIRIRSEEGLLRGAFGDDFEAYRRYVPAVIPRWKT